MRYGNDNPSQRRAVEVINRYIDLSLEELSHNTRSGTDRAKVYTEMAKIAAMVEMWPSRDAEAGVPNALAKVARALDRVADQIRRHGS